MTPNEQIEVITGEYNPNGTGPGAIQPIQTASQEAVQWGVAFLQNQKVFPTVDGQGEPINQLAASYVSKMRVTIQEVFEYRAQTQQKLIRLYMATLSAIGITWAQFQAYTEVAMASGTRKRIPTSYGGCRQYHPAGESGI